MLRNLQEDHRHVTVTAGHMTKEYMSRGSCDMEATWSGGLMGHVTLMLWAAAWSTWVM